LARKLLDLGDAATAFQVVQNAAPPVNPYYRADLHFIGSMRGMLKTESW